MALLSGAARPWTTPWDMASSTLPVVLVEQGARTKLWHAAALGLLARVEDYFNSATPPAPKQITEAFWQACHGGQRETAEYLLARGAELNWIPPWSPQTPLDMAQVTNPGRAPAPDFATGPKWITRRKNS